MATPSSIGMDAIISPLAQLPDELLLESIEYLDKCSLVRFGLSCKWAYGKAMPLVWNEIKLVDCRTRHNDMPYHEDEHDDTPIIHKLITLSRNPQIASYVHTLSHSCHLLPPAIVADLPYVNFQSRLVSHDPRTLQLLYDACMNLTNLQTLRIIFGHWYITKGLLAAILSPKRKRIKPLTRLWLENCSLAGIPAGILDSFDLNGIQSIRLRRLSLLPEPGTHSFLPQQVQSRSRTKLQFQTGRSNFYTTNVEEWVRQETVVHNAIQNPNSFADWARFFLDAHNYDDIIYDQVRAWANTDDPFYQNERLPHRLRLKTHLAELARAGDLPTHFERNTNPMPAVLALLQSSMNTLTSLNLDWLMLYQAKEPLPASVQRDRSTVLKNIFNLRFPNLKAFQFRNAIFHETKLPRGLYLLDKCDLNVDRWDAQAPEDLLIDFMEAHPKLCCLGWPMDRFFNSRKHIRSNRVTKIIDILARNLVDLRVETEYSSDGEWKSDNSRPEFINIHVRDNRRLFISEFAARMEKIEYLKIEGSVPRDERRETARALRQCPLRKIVLIGANFPLGNTWGIRGEDIPPRAIVDDSREAHEQGSLEDEDIQAITQFGAVAPTAPPYHETFLAEYGWQPSPPLIHTLAAYHANTVTELKICGFQGAPLLWDTTPVTTPIFSPLRHFHKLESFSLSILFPTIFQDDYRDYQILEYWFNTQSPAATALVVPHNADNSPWPTALREYYEPESIARRLKNLIAPFLSESVKVRKGGVHVRANFCIGEEADILDFDLVIGKAPNGEDVVLSWVGPRDEHDTERKTQRLERRRWF